tara:strand:+ start:157 stop:618 length:462 start_codon:yes stop_codon:yes gene_type:complete
MKFVLFAVLLLSHTATAQSLCRIHISSFGMHMKASSVETFEAMPMHIFSAIEFPLGKVTQAFHRRGYQLASSRSDASVTLDVNLICEQYLQKDSSYGLAGDVCGDFKATATFSSIEDPEDQVTYEGQSDPILFFEGDPYKAILRAVEKLDPCL